jgi:hypothetical protein
MNSLSGLPAMICARKLKVIFQISLVGLAVLMSGCHMSKRVSVRGTVVDDATGKPVAGAKICMRSLYCGISSADFDDRTTTTDSAGAFEFSNVTLKDHLVTAEYSRISLCAIKNGYDWTEANLVYSSNFRSNLGIRLQKDRQWTSAASARSRQARDEGLIFIRSS